MNSHKNLNDAQINYLITTLEKVLFANQPVVNTREEYALYEAWMRERKAISNSYKAALVSGDIEEANRITNSVLSTEEDDDLGLGDYT